MDSSAIQHTLRKVDNRLIDQLSEEEKSKAMHYFRMVYADEVGKMSDEAVRRRKVQDNLQQLMQQEMDFKEETEVAIRHRMRLYEQNREKKQEAKSKGHKQSEENWQKRWGEIARKRKRETAGMQEKAQQVRKETEEYWNNKEKAERERQKSIVEKAKLREQQLLEPFYSGTPLNLMDSSHPIPEEGIRRTQPYHQEKKTVSNTVTSKMTSQLPSFRRTNPEKHQKSLSVNRTIDLVGHQDRSTRASEQREQETLQKVMKKLERIEKSRLDVQERMQKQVEAARKERLKRQNPELLARNRQRSNDYLQMKARKHTIRQEADRHETLRNSPHGGSRIQQSLSQHIEAKRRLSELQFAEREEAWQARAKRVKQSRLQKVIREAVAHLRHEGQKQESQS